MRSVFVACCVASVFVSHSGCSVLPAPLSGMAPTLPPATEVSATTSETLQPSQEFIDFQRVQRAASMNSVVLQQNGESGGRPKIIQLPQTGQTVYLSNFLQQTGTDKLSKNNEIAVWRDSAQAPEGAKLAVRFLRGGRIDPLTDYALRPGDRIVITPAASKSWIDTLF